MRMPTTSLKTWTLLFMFFSSNLTNQLWGTYCKPGGGVFQPADLIQKATTTGHEIIIILCMEK